MSGKYGDLIREARKPESQKDGLLVNEQEGKAESTQVIAVAKHLSDFFVGFT